VIVRKVEPPLPRDTPVAGHGEDDANDN
jgi:hypothetical protein